VSRLVVMGSGETAPTMVRVHREVFAEVGEGTAVLLNTPFSFQMNADELVARTLTYFGDSVGRQVEVVHWARRDAPVAEQERALALLARARWAFAGPGSPTYALRQWRDTAVPASLTGVVRRGGTVVLGSAAAVTLGEASVPVYEIYKVGEDPAWVEGLDLLRALTGLRAAVVPHYDNKEGGTHDTRFCYLGEKRLAALEESLSDETGVLGVDEHTAALLDLEARTLTVAGSGVVTVRRRGRSRTFASGEHLGFAQLDALLRGDDSAGPAVTTTVAVTPAEDDVPTEAAVPTSLREAADAAQVTFEKALAGRDVEACVATILDLEQTLAAWQADTLQSDDTGHARRALRAMVVRLGELAEVGADPEATLRPAVGLLLDLRTRARAAGDFATSDEVRDRLGAAGVEVRDTPEGAVWSLRDPGASAQP
jgi:cyanophycinase-like exopeptidase